MLTLDTENGRIDWGKSLPATNRGAVDLCKYHDISLQPEGRSLLQAGLSTQEYFELLLENRCYADARRVLAHALSKRRALWWGCLCTWDVYRPQPPGEIVNVLQAVVRFVLDPSEVNRRATATRAQEAEPNTLAGCLAMAAFCSDGSIAAPGLPCVAPRPFITGRLVGVTVYLAAVLRDPARYRDHLRQYLAVGVDVARGANLWTDGGTSEPVEAPASGIDQVLATEVVPAGEIFQLAVGPDSFLAEEVLVQPAPADQENLVTVT